LEAILDSAVGAIITIDERGTVHSFNPLAERMFGYAPSEVVGKRVAMLMTEPDRSEHEPCLTAFFATGRKKAIGTRREFTGRRKDGTEFPFEVSVAEVRSTQGRFFTAILHDITERKRVEHELRRSEERYRQLVANINDALIVDDEQGRLTYANGRFFELFGFSADDLLSIRTEDYVAPAYHEKLRDFHERRMRGEEVPRQFEYEGRRRDGSSLWLEACVTPVTKDGVVIGTQSLIRDATARKRAEEQLRHREAELAHATRLSAVGELATGIAHELNQPLATIVNYAESARLRLDQDPGSSSEETGVRLEKIAAEAKRAGEIIHRMRHLLRNKEPQWSVVDLNECATVIADLIKSEARLKGVSVRLRLADDNPAVSGDGIQIQQVILNLVRNGMDAIAERPADRDTLTITTELVADGLVRCSVGDSGGGLSDDGFDRLFEPFNTTKSDGLGLGLSVSRWIIEAHGGQITAARRPGGGALFSFVLPVIRGMDYGGR
ncbi:MAG: PAS domain S-box protein, partial [Planctomycetes bacterium]|nr:PAS domain S-box protein [Planctomycetota bacterium]